MADKQQNILVNLKYNTAELERGERIVNRANEANNRLQQSAEKAGSGASQAYRGATQSIGAMQMQLARLKTMIEVSSNPQKVAQLSQQYKQLKAELDRATKAAFENTKALKEQGTAIKGATQNFGQLFTAIKTFVAAGIVREVLQTSLEMAKLAGNVEGVSRAFNRAFPDAKLLMADLQRATHGTVSEFELMQRTLQATNLGVAVEQLPILFEFAAARAQQTGESVDYLVDSIVRGIGRKSILVLDNLGLSATRLKEQFNGASLASQSVADVTRGVAAIAQVELAKMGGYAETSATKVDQLTVAWKELRVELSKRFEEGGFVTQLTELVNSYQALAEAQRRGISVEELFKERQREEIAQISVRTSLQFALTGERENDIKIIEDQIAAVTKSIGSWAAYRDSQNAVIKAQREEQIALRDGTNGLSMTGKERRKQIDALGEQIELNKRLRDANKEDALIDQEILKLLQSKLQALQKDNTVEKEALGIIEAKKQQIEALNEQIEKTRSFSDLSSRLQVGKLINELAIAQAELKELLDGGANIEFKVKFDVEKLNTEFKRAIEVINTRAKDGREFSVEVPVGPSKDKAKVLKDFEVLTDILKDIEPIPIPVQPTVIVPKDFGDHLEDAIKGSREDLINTGTEIFADQLISFEEAEVASLQNRLNNLRNFYDEQILLAGDNDRAKQQLRLKEERETAALQKKIAQREKEARRFSVIIDTAAGIARAFATAPNIAVAVVQAALVAAQGASQLAIINRTTPRFANGVINLKGPGTGTSDSIDAKLSKGESVMTAKETKSSMGILKDIRAKKLDDKVLQGLKLTSDGVKYVGMDDSRIVKEIRDLKNSQPDLVEQSGKLYRHYSKGKDYKQKVRVKSMGY
jgi:hypothetical protein